VRAAGEGNAEGGELLGRPADADAESKAAGRQHVQGRGLLGGQDRVVLGEEQDAGRQADGGGRGGDEAEAEQRVQPVGVGRDGDAAVG
jgi:hypothetical protein